MNLFRNEISPQQKQIEDENEKKRENVNSDDIKPKMKDLPKPALLAELSDCCKHIGLVMYLDIAKPLLEHLRYQIDECQHVEHKNHPSRLIHFSYGRRCSHHLRWASHNGPLGLCFTRLHDVHDVIRRLCKVAFGRH